MDDAIAASIRSTHLEMNMGVPNTTDDGGGVPTLAALCRERLCTATEIPLPGEVGVKVEPFRVPHDTSPATENEMIRYMTMFKDALADECAHSMFKRRRQKTHA